MTQEKNRNRMALFLVRCSWFLVLGYQHNGLSCSGSLRLRIIANPQHLGIVLGNGIGKEPVSHIRVYQTRFLQFRRNRFRSVMRPCDACSERTLAKRRVPSRTSRAGAWPDFHFAVALSETCQKKYDFRTKWQCPAKQFDPSRS